MQTAMEQEPHMSKIVWTAIIVRHARDLGPLVRAAAAGDRVSRGFLLGLGQWLKMHRRVAAKKAPLCLACEHAFRRGVELPFTFMMTYSEDPRVEQIALTGVCETCAQMSDPELLKYGSESICKMLDGGRVVGLHHVGSQSDSTH
jgi:hypothetical protein